MKFERNKTDMQFSHYTSCNIVYVQYNYLGFNYLLLISLSQNLRAL